VEQRSPEQHHIALERTLAGDQAQQQSREERIPGFDSLQLPPQRG